MPHTSSYRFMAEWRNTASKGGYWSKRYFMRLESALKFRIGRSGVSLWRKSGSGWLRLESN